MGGSGSKDSRKKDGVYAELVSGKGDDSDFPPIKVILNEQITNSAVDSLKDSEEMIHLLAKNLIIGVLEDKSTTGKFGQILSYVFDYESTLSQTRSMLYWSLNTPDVTKNIQSLSAYQVKQWSDSYGVKQVSSLAQAWVVAVPSRKEVISPLLSWVLTQKTYVVDPSALLIFDTLPYYKDSVKDGLKNAILENLKSESAKSAVKDMIVQNLVKYSAKRLAEPTPADVTADAADNTLKRASISTPTTVSVIVDTTDHCQPASTNPETRVGGTGATTGPHEPPTEEDCT